MTSKSKGTQNEAKKESEITGGRKFAYDKMNTIVANLLSNLTCSMRF